MEDLQIVESVVRKDSKVIEQCGIIGIPPEDMHKVYCDRRFDRVTVIALLMTHSMDNWLR
jgi:Cu2+-containing amine oxidase